MGAIWAQLRITTGKGRQSGLGGQTEVGSAGVFSSNRLSEVKEGIRKTRSSNGSWLKPPTLVKRLMAVNRR